MTKNKKPAKGSNREDESPARKRPRFDLVPEQVKDEYTRMASTIATTTEDYSEALKEALDAKTAKEACFARKYMEICQQAEDADIKKPSETYIKQKIIDDAEYAKACAEFNEAEYRKSQLLGDLEALRTKRDMLVSLGAHVRAEISAGGGALDDDEEMDTDDEED